MPSAARAPSRYQLLRPPRSRTPWVAWGFTAQLLGAGGVAVVLWRNIRGQGIAGHITAELIRVAWRSELHTRAGLMVLIAGAVVYAAGSILMARPYISRPVTLFVAVPAAAVVGVLALGVLALLLAVVFVTLANGDFFDLDLGGHRRRRRRPPR
jgi:hypothetical protein